MEQEIEQLQNKVDEIRKELSNNQKLISEKINNRIAILETENAYIYSDPEIVDLNMTLLRIEREANNKINKLLSQIKEKKDKIKEKNDRIEAINKEIDEFEKGKKDRIDAINKKIYDKVDKLTQAGYSYSDIYLDDEIKNLQAEIELIKKEKIITKIELEEAQKTYQSLEDEKHQIEEQIKKIEDTDITTHLLEEKKQLEEEIKRLRAKGKDDNDSEIKEYLSDIEKINNELQRRMLNGKDEKDRYVKIIKDMEKLESKYGKDKLEKSNKQSTTQQNPTQTDPAQTATQQDSAQTTSQDPAQTTTQQDSAQTTSQDPAQTATQQDPAQTTSQDPAQTTTQQDSAQTSAVNINFSSKGIFVDGKWVNIKEIDNIHDFIESEKTKANGNVTLNFDLRGMSSLSKILKTSILTGKQIDQIKDLAFQNRENSNINNDVFTNLEFKIKDTIKKIKQKKLPSSSSKNDTRQASTSVDSSTQVNRKNFLNKIKAKIDKSKQGSSSEQNNNEKSNTNQNNQNRDEGR